MRVVFDTNVYLAASKEGSYCDVQLRRCHPGGSSQLFVSPEIILEVQDKLQVKFGYTKADAAEFIQMIMLYAQIVYPRQKITGVLQDTDDHAILECAAESRAQVIFTADKQMLKLAECHTIKISHPRMLQYWL
jgi:putative PIN family toxin of toxin-antitoxin system